MFILKSLISKNTMFLFNICTNTMETLTMKSNLIFNRTIIDLIMQVLKVDDLNII